MLHEKDTILHESKKLKLLYGVDDAMLQENSLNSTTSNTH